jgi:hypothetical protein
MKPSEFQDMIRRILLEEVEKRSVTDREIYERVPEVVHGEEYKEIVPHKRDGQTKDEILQAITKTVKALDSSATVVWDDHDDISVSARDMLRVRISPRWENSYNIEAMIRNEDRIYVTNQTIDQVNEFLKVNLKNVTTSTQKAYDKSKHNADLKNDETPKPDKGMPQKDKPKTLPLTNEPPSTGKNKDRNYTEKQTKEEKDLPEKPMYEVSGFKKQVDHKSRNPAAIRKEKTKFPSKKPNTTLTVPISKQG